MTGSKRRAGRRGRFALLGALTATAVLAFGVSSAQAVVVPLSVDFDDAKLNLPSPVGTTDILDPPDVATLDGTADTATGALNVPAGNFVFPSFDGDLSGIPLTVEFSAVDDITGTAGLDGTVTTNPSTFETVVALGAPLNSSCTYNSEEALSTGAGTPFNGDPFTVTVGMSGATATDGIVQTGWGTNHFTLTDSTGDCSLVTGLINAGCGGLAMANTPPEPVATDCAATGGGGGTTTPPPTTNTAAQLKKCKKKAKKIKDPVKRKKQLKKCKKKFG